jgi:acid phosphatase (class B)
MNRGLSQYLLFCFLLLLAGCGHGAEPLTVASLAASLPEPPIAVGFDVDETLICSTPVWYYLATNHDGPDGNNKYGVYVRKHPEFWPDANRLDSFSVPKQAAKELLALHQRRGDHIYIITSRFQTPGEQLTATLRSAFDLDQSIPVLFTGNRPKATLMCELKLAIFYGDSDDDMRDARAAGARPIRFLRSLHCADDRIHIGAYGEQVLSGSDVGIAFARAGPATRPAKR